MFFGACSGISLREELLTAKALVNAVRSHTVPITFINFATIAAVERQRCRIYNSHKKWDYLERDVYPIAVKYVIYHMNIVTRLRYRRQGVR